VIFVDTGAWFAVAVRNDPDHDAAMAWIEGSHDALITTDYVMAETATLIRMRDKTARGHRLAVRLQVHFCDNRQPSWKGSSIET